jgi:hypothetical protein
MQKDFAERVQDEFEKMIEAAAPVAKNTNRRSN